jgi:hypothetical protein
VDSEVFLCKLQLGIVFKDTMATAMTVVEVVVMIMK